MTLSAPATFNGNTFLRWTTSESVVSAARNITVNLDSSLSLTAEYLDADDSDTDNDNLDDTWELTYFGNLTFNGSHNNDMDSLTNLEEFIVGTNPVNSDTDGDGMPDGWEVDNDLNPLDAADASQNPDGDDFTNLEEYQSGTNPQVAEAANAAALPAMLQILLLDD